MIFNKLESIFCIILLSQGILILAQPQVIPCNFEGEVSPTNFCTLEFQPVCAFSEDCQGDACFGTTVGNSCQACTQDGYDYYTEGTCPRNEAEEVVGGEEFNEGVIWCQSPGPNIEILCTSDFVPVCAYFANEEGSVGETISNACVACNQLGFDYYTQGVCESGISEEETGAKEEETGGVEGPIQIPCEDLTFESLEAVCRLEFDPVCAFSFESNSVGSFAANPCVACFLQGFDYYTPGRCPS